MFEMISVLILLIILVLALLVVVATQATTINTLTTLLSNQQELQSIKRELQNAQQELVVVHDYNQKLVGQLTHATAELKGAWDAHYELEQAAEEIHETVAYMKSLNEELNKPATTTVQEAPPPTASASAQEASSSTATSIHVQEVFRKDEQFNEILDEINNNQNDVVYTDEASTNYIKHEAFLVSSPIGNNTKRPYSRASTTIADIVESFTKSDSLNQIVSTPKELIDANAFCTSASIPVPVVESWHFPYNSVEELLNVGDLGIDESDDCEGAAVNPTTSTTEVVDYRVGNGSNAVDKDVSTSENNTAINQMFRESFEKVDALSIEEPIDYDYIFA